MAVDNRRVPFHAVLGVDGSDNALAAAQLLHDLPLPPGSLVTALAVLTPDRQPDIPELMDALDHTAAMLSRQSIQIETDLLQGNPVEQLNRFGLKSGCDLILIGAAEPRNRLDVLLGNPEQLTIEEAPCPTLIARAPYTGLRCVLLAIDGSEHSLEAIQYLARFPLPNQAKATVLHVVAPRPEAAAASANGQPWRPSAASRPIAVYELDTTVSSAREAEERYGGAILHHAAQVLNAANIPADTMLASGDPAAAILEHAESARADLLVSGSRGLSRVKSWLMNSVSRKLVQAAPCSVMVVKSRAGGNDASPGEP